MDLAEQARSKGLEIFIGKWRIVRELNELRFSVSQIRFSRSAA